MAKRKPPLPAGQRRCPQCWQPRKLREFRSRRFPERLTQRCLSCQEHYSQPNPEPRSWRGNHFDDAPLRVRLIERSKNRKLGEIPATFSSPCTCPKSCPWYGRGCYSEHDLTGHWWRETTDVGMTWPAFCDRVSRFPRGQVWRHNIGGDLPGVDSAIDLGAMLDLEAAASHTRGFTYTHKPLNATNQRILRRCNRADTGLVVRLSADGIGQVDELCGLDCGPVAVVLPSDAPRVQRTAAGRTVLVCPAQYAETSCAVCGLCTDNWRMVIGFRAHGCAAKRVSLRSKAL